MVTPVTWPDEAEGSVFICRLIDRGRHGKSVAQGACLRTFAGVSRGCGAASGQAQAEVTRMVRPAHRMPEDFGARV
jgi:hypothetical protein